MSYYPPTYRRPPARSSHGKWALASLLTCGLALPFWGLYAGYRIIYRLAVSGRR